MLQGLNFGSIKTSSTWFELPRAFRSSLPMERWRRMQSSPASEPSAITVGEADGSIQGRITGLRGRFRGVGRPPAAGQAGPAGEEGARRGRR